MSTSIQIGGSSKMSKRHEWTGVYDYMAWAPYGSSESSNVWTITRLIISSAGNVTKGVAEGAWSNRATLIYT